MKEELAVLKAEKKEINKQIKAVKRAYKQTNPGWFSRRKQRMEQAMYLRLKARCEAKTEEQMVAAEEAIDNKLDRLESILDVAEAKGATC